MPTALPGMSIGQAAALLGEQDRVLRSFPEVESVFGSVGRGADSGGAFRYAAGPIHFAEHVSQGFYINVEPDRAEAARYGLRVEDIQRAVASGIGGQDIAENVERREHYPINVRYEQRFRDSPQRMAGVLIGTPSGTQIPLGEVARIHFSRGPSMIRDEDGALTGYIYIDLKDNQLWRICIASREPASIETPSTCRIFVSVAEALVLIFPALTGGLLLQYLLGYNFSLAVWVGYIALFGIPVETCSDFALSL